MNNVEQPIAVVLGASRLREKYGNKAVRAYRSQGYRVYPVNPHATEIEGIPAVGSLDEISEETIDLVSVYLPPEQGISLLEEIQRLHPREVWFNPGSESPELLEKAASLGLPMIQACSILGIGRSPGEFGK